LRRERILQSVRTAEFAYEPGTESQYSDIGMMLMGDVVEQLTGSRLDEVFEREVAAPLRLRDTFFRHLDAPLAKAIRPTEAFAATEVCAWRNTVVRGWVHDENAYLLLGVAGHAGLFATADEVLRLGATLVACYHGRTDFLHAATVRQFVRRQDGVAGSDRALGWGTASPGASCGSGFSPQAFGHTGFTGTSVWIDPEVERVVVLLANRVHPSRDNAVFGQFRPGFHDLVVEALTTA
jgi:CubicO group peptidase (beta-lactamase class C family)